MESPEDLLTPKQAASLMGVAAKTLKNWRNQKRGPAFVRLGHHTVRYRRVALQNWLLALETQGVHPGASALQIQPPPAQ